jgi:predicted transcriptional regulator
MDKKTAPSMLHEIQEQTLWTQPKLAAELGTSQPTVHRILNGQEECKVSTFQAILSLHKSVLARKKRAASNLAKSSHKNT